LKNKNKILFKVVLGFIHTNSINLGWLLFWAKATIAHVDIGISSCAITSVELSFA